MTPELHTIDLNYLGTPQAIASYVLLGPEGPVMIETGPGRTVGALEAGLAGIGLKPSDVKHTLITHLHFDHAGASGWMASHGSHVYVHEVGYKHLIDPSKLIASAKRIYQDRMDELWGELLPIPEAQLTAVNDGDVLSVGGLQIHALDTPGHAWHHHAYAVETTSGTICFTGDAAATFIPETRFISLPTPPPEFDLDAWLATIDRLEAANFSALYPTHFGAVGNPAAHLARVRALIREHAGLVRRAMDEGCNDDEINRRYREWFIREAQEAGTPAEKIGFFVTDTMADMNVMGLLRYWKKQAEKAAS